MIIYYHKSCIDGLIAAWIAYQQFGPNVATVPVAYGDEPDWVLLAQHTSVVIVDFSFDPKYLPRLCAGRKVTMLDHHKSAIELYNQMDTSMLHKLVFDTSRSGAKLAYDEFYGQADPHPDSSIALLRTIANLVDDRDRWVFADSRTKPFNRVLGGYVHMSVPDFDRAVGCRMLQQPTEIDLIVDRGRALVADDEQQIDNIVRHAWTANVTINGVHYLVPVVNCEPRYCSEVGNRLASAAPVKWSLTFSVSRSGLNLSFRSVEGGPDVSTLAACYGGGGHYHAAGAGKLPVTHIQEFMP